MLKTAKIVGLNSDALAAQVLISESTPQFFALISVVGDDAFNRGRSALLEAEDSFVSSQFAIADRLSEALQIIKKSLSDTEKLAMVLAAVVESKTAAVLYLITEGEQIHAVLIRDNQETNLVDIGGGSQLISGFLQEDDRVILATNSLFKLLGGEWIKLTNLSIDSLEEEVVGKLPQATVDPVAMIALEREITAPAEIKEAQGISPDHQPAFGATDFKVMLPTLFEKGKSLLIKSWPKTKTGLALLGLILMLVVVLGTVFTFRYQKKERVESEFKSNLDSAKNAFSQAQNLKDLNPQSAKQNLDLAQDFIKQALKVKPKDTKALEFDKEIRSKEGDILKIYHIGELATWLDLELIKKGFSSKSLSFSVGKILLLDPAQKTLVSLDTAKKATEILAGADKLGDGKFASLNGNVAFVYSEDKGVVKVDATNNTTTVAVKKDPEWGNILAVYGFANNIYLLDEGKNKILKYLPIASGYSEKRDYLSEKTSANFSQSLNLQIDGSVWVLKLNGEILKYTQGNQDFFALAGLDKPIKDAKSFFVSSEAEKLYLLDGGNSRILVLDKKGGYLGQYLSDKLANMDDLVVDEKGKRIYLVDGSKIYMVELR